jgi:hypothetical protein
LAILKESGFHSMKTMEFRLKEHYVDEVEYELAPKEKRQKPAGNTAHLATGGMASEGEDTGAEADNEKSEYETEGDQASLATAGTAAAKVVLINNPTLSPAEVATTTTVANSTTTTTPKRAKKFLVARPFAVMRGHTAFLTFATAGNKAQPDPNRTVGKTGEILPTGS